MAPIPSHIDIDWVWSPRITYCRAHNDDTVELPMTAISGSETNSIDTSYRNHAMDTKDTEPSSRGRSKSLWCFGKRHTGWKSGLLSFATFASVVFLINLVLTIWCSSYNAGEGVLRDGDCEDIRRWNSGLHVLINIFSTILLSGSNYGMQCLSAPTRKEVDEAHKKGRRLDIGILSVRNLTRIDRKRTILWILLAISSLPLHLLYNSAIYAVISANNYTAFLVSEEFVEGTECRNCTAGTLLKTMWDESKSKTLNQLSPSECLAQYESVIQTDKRNLLLITGSEHALPRFNVSLTESWGLNEPEFLTPMNNTNVYYVYAFDSYDGINGLMNGRNGWITSGIHNRKTYLQNLDEVKRSPDAWNVGAYFSNMTASEEARWPVRYCLSERVVPRCRLQFHSVVATIVTCLNFFKAALMLYVAYSIKDDPFMTMGDAVASFLQKSDTTTQNLSLFNLQRHQKGSVFDSRHWTDTKTQWKDATSKTRRTITVVLFIIALSIIISLLARGVQQTARQSELSTLGVLSLGFGAVNPNALIDYEHFPTTIAGLALIANLPQVILSFLYFSYNTLFTAMLMGYEWTSYAYKRKGLRVSRTAKGSQRSTYFLQLPYRFGLPLVVLSSVLHWLVSQSIFLVAIDTYTARGKLRYSAGIRKCGYSPVAMGVVVILGGLMVLAVIGFGFTPYKRGIPLAGTSSLAISAACHPPDTQKSGEGLMSEQELQWGIVETSVDGIGRCAFSSQEVGLLVKGRMYI